MLGTFLGSIKIGQWICRKLSSDIDIDSILIIQVW